MKFSELQMTELQMTDLPSAQNQKGFTLIELMIVVAIIGILAVVASNAYLNYTIRAQVSEALSLMSHMTTGVAEHYNHTGRYPASNESLGLAQAVSIVGNYVDHVDVNGSPSIIEARFGNRASDRITGQLLQFSVITNEVGIVRWQCRSLTISDNYLPIVCRD